ncbi:MAG: hypothetical protein PHP87_07435 [Syntrophomonas sp.]|uniref:hypothetical protein n=1 Tax=Syntrophomonas sp. TaxID=2053627 RepID=UPI00262F83D7|nr:hypothetical protein [Syntrophomonas sp.]MDD4626905.1 hypothetical protein [Syntrophomonas sp.]
MNFLNYHLLPHLNALRHLHHSIQAPTNSLFIGGCGLTLHPSPCRVGLMLPAVAIVVAAMGV